MTAQDKIHRFYQMGLVEPFGNYSAHPART
jgi:hypothetical protein